MVSTIGTYFIGIQNAGFVQFACAELTGHPFLLLCLAPARLLLGGFSATPRATRLSLLLLLMGLLLCSANAAIIMQLLIPGAFCGPAKACMSNPSPLKDVLVQARSDFICLVSSTQLVSSAFFGPSQHMIWANFHPLQINPVFCRGVFSCRNSSSRRLGRDLSPPLHVF